MTTRDSFVLEGHAKFQSSRQAKQLNLTTLLVMVECSISCLKEEDPKTCTWFKDCTGVFKEVMQSTERFRM